MQHLSHICNRLHDSARKASNVFVTILNNPDDELFVVAT